VIARWPLPSRLPSTTFAVDEEGTRLATFGEQVRTLRRNAGLTGIELARLVGVSQSFISRIETGHVVPEPDVVERLATALGADPVELGEQARAARSTMRSWRTLHASGFDKHQQDLARRERNATHLRLFQPNIVPGLLQTAEYARYAIELATTSQELASAVAARVARQSILYERSKSFEFLITEGALRWRIVPTDVHAAQLDRISSLSTLANVSVGIIPLWARVAAHQSNMFMLLDDDFGYLETMTGEITMQHRPDLEQYGAIWNALTQAAVTGEDARAELDRISRTLERP
jgi:transcriptional regulator with XRE-family HTH domain